MTLSTRSRNTAKLSTSLSHNLNMYALAASAAGVGVLALASPAEGKIVYTPAHKSIILSLTTLVRVKHFLSTLLRGREEQRHFALAERF